MLWNDSCATLLAAFLCTMRYCVLFRVMSGHIDGGMPVRYLFVLQIAFVQPPS